MRFPVMLLIITLPFVLSVLAHPGRHSARSVGSAIPISRRNEARSTDGEVNVPFLKASTQRRISTILIGLSNFERNTGNVHPLANGQAEGASSRSYSKRATGSVPLVDNVYWYGVIEVGNPPKPFTVAVETSGSDTFLPSILCDSSCDGHDRYDPSASSTAIDLHKPLNLTYGEGDAFVEEYSDTVSIASLTAYNQTLGAALVYSSDFLVANFSIDGVMGMAYQSASAFNSPPLFQTLVAQGSVTQPQFAFKLAETGAELYLGGTNPELYKGCFTYVPVTEQGFWQTYLGGIVVGEYGPVLLSDITAIISTGTPGIIGNEKDVKAIYAQIPGSQPVDPKYNLEGSYTIPCNFSTVVSFVFGLKEFPVAPNTFHLGILDPNDPSLCLGGLSYDSSLAQENITFWLIGDVFLQNVYTVFDLGNNVIGFADLASDDLSSELGS